MGYERQFSGSDCITPQRSGTEFVVSKLVLRQGARTYESPGTEACPDFSTGASSMRFGYLRTAYGEPLQSVVHTVDNWTVTVWRR
jgi:hypothetical protein